MTDPTGDAATLWNILTSPTLLTVAAGAAVLGALSGTLGCFAVMRRQSLVGDAVSHAALPGIALVFLLTGTKSSLGLLIGAGIAGWLGMLAVLAITRTTRIPDDTALGVILATFFGLGLMLLTFIQKIPDANQAGLDTYLFGQAATLLREDVMLMSGAACVAFGLLGFFWKELKLVTFDREYARTVGFPVHGLEMLLTVLLVGAIVLGLRTVGVVLMSAMVVAPAAAARQWTNRFSRMVLLAGVFGAFAGTAGAIASSLVRHLPTGPMIVLIATGWAIASLFIGSAHGLAWRWLRMRLLQRKLAEEAVLVNLYELAETHGDLEHPHGEGAIKALSPPNVSVPKALQVLEKKELVRESAKGTWALTDKGIVEARNLRSKEGGKA